jgi:hypothetical protein
MAANQQVGFDKLKVRSWLRQGELGLAMSYMTECADSGSIDALISLADHYFDVGDVKLSINCMERAESTLRVDDLDGHVSLASAYRFGLGAGDPKSRQRHALVHLEKVGEAGNPVVQESLMLHYLHGLNGAQADQGRALYWAKKAADSGSELAKAELKKVRP